MDESFHISTSHVTMNESCHVSTSHVTCQRVMSHINESCHMSTSQATHESVRSHMNEAFHLSASHGTHQRVMPQEGVRKNRRGYARHLRKNMTGHERVGGSGRGHLGTHVFERSNVKGVTLSIAVCCNVLQCVVVCCSVL